MAFIEVAHLTKTFRWRVRPQGSFAGLRWLATRSYEETAALRDVGFTMDAGEAVGYIGPKTVRTHYARRRRSRPPPAGVARRRLDRGRPRGWPTPWWCAAAAARRMGKGNQMTPYASIRCKATRQDRTLSVPSGCRPLSVAQTARAIASRVSWRGSSVMARMTSISARLSTRPQ